MKVLELGKFYPPDRGGIETLLRLWSEGLVELGNEVDCVVSNRRARTESEVVGGVRVHRLARYGEWMSTSLCPSYLGVTRRWEADIWHAHFPNPLADVACLLGPRRVPLVVHWHSDIVRQRAFLKLYGPIVRAVLRRADRIVVATPVHWETSEWLRPHEGKISVIPFGLDLERFERSAGVEARIAALRERAGGRTVFLNVGRLVGYKGQKYVIEAMRRVEGVLWLAGTGPLEGVLKAQVEEAGLGSRVVFFGDVSEEELVALMHACDVFVLPSITPNEAFGLVLVEAMACGKPLIACKIRSGVTYVCSNGENGLLVPPSDPVALGDTMSQMASDSVLRKILGEKGKQRASLEFSKLAMLRQTSDLFHSLVSGRTGTRPA